MKSIALALVGLALVATSSYGAESLMAIPEPGTLSLACLGGLGVLLFRRRK